jgi:hypothetical protein
MTKAEKVVIRWPSGLVETITELPANRYYVINEGKGIDSKKTREPSNLKIAGSAEKP